jgi:hypothetical protein
MGKVDQPQERAPADVLRDRGGTAAAYGFVLVVLSILSSALSLLDWDGASTNSVQTWLRLVTVLGFVMAALCGAVTYLLYSAAAAVEATGQTSENERQA